MRPSAKRAFLKDIENAFKISHRDIENIIKNFYAEMERGLLGQKSSLKMIPTYVKKPSGGEKGRFLALDVGGTNFRVWAVTLNGKRKIKSAVSKKFLFKKNHTTGKGKVLFGFIARSVRKLMLELDMVPAGKYEAGFTFSFPIKNRRIGSAVLLAWTKGFRASGVLGKDVVKLLNGALKKEGLTGTKVVSISNDTVSTFAAKNYEDPNCSIGVILGTGTNACYGEKVEKIKKLKNPCFESQEMLINIEWGNFNKLHLTPYDREVDINSSNRGEQILEKMVSGMYLGELTRSVIRRLIEKRILFDGCLPRIFKKAGNFKSENVSTIEKDTTKKLSRTDMLLKKSGTPKSTFEDRRFLKYVCAAVSGRAARVSAALVAAVLAKIDPGILKKHTVAIDGSVYEKHPGFSRNMRITLTEIFGKKAKNIKLSLAKDGSGIGAAVIAGSQTNCR